ncbi:hypothetical protein BHM03_00001219 [Ensete ventricosum]|nr:hypothetical protein BHM03_00001219 [Ensete ventricosum]
MDSRGVEAGVNPADGRRPDIYELFCHYNALYFRDALGTCALSWASSSPYPSDHGPRFQDMMNSINSNSVIDPQVCDQYGLVVLSGFLPQLISLPTTETDRGIQHHDQS